MAERKVYVNLRLQNSRIYGIQSPVADDEPVPYADHYFTKLRDTPNTLSAGYLVEVNSTGDALVFAHLVDDSATPASNVLWSSQKIKSEIDSALNGLDWQESVKDKDVADPSTLTPSAGDRYIVAGGAVGDWSGHDYEIAEWDGSVWVFTTPDEGTAVFVEDENRSYVYNAPWDGTDHWVPFASIVDHNSLLNLQGGATGEYFHLTQTEHDTLVGGGTADSLHVHTFAGGLTDTPASYSGYAGYLVRVNDTEDGLEYVAPNVVGQTKSYTGSFTSADWTSTGAGDYVLTVSHNMGLASKEVTVAVYDTDGNIVDVVVVAVDVNTVELYSNAAFDGSLIVIGKS